MYVRSEVYYQFMEQYPNAEFMVVHHENGRASEIAPGKFQGQVEEVFVGTYEADGSHVGESRIPEDMLVPPETLLSDDPMHAYNVGANRAISHANSPIRPKP
jgi:hypothetical protein